MSAFDIIADAPPSQPHDHDHDHAHDHSHDHTHRQEHARAVSAEDDEENAEIQHWHNVMRTFLHYEDFYCDELSRRQSHLNKLSDRHARRLPEMTFGKLDDLHKACQLNQGFFREMVDFHAQNSFMDYPNYPTKTNGPEISPAQQHRNQAVLHSLYREWSQEGQLERSTSFARLIAELKAQLPVTADNAYQYRVLAPGSGVGRLPLEIAGEGYRCEGNEFSAFMAIASNFILNGTGQAQQHTIHPWIESVCNIEKISDTLVGVAIPDRAPVDILREAADKFPSMNSIETGVFSMSTGDFTEVYGTRDNEGKWDAVVTCFFIDTAPVVFDYIDVIQHILKPGGVWINLGPLLYHWVSDSEDNQDPRYAKSVELSYEELKHVIRSYGFSLLKEEWNESIYSKCHNSMMWTVYRTVLFVAQKPLSAESTVSDL